MPHDLSFDAPARTSSDGPDSGRRRFMTTTAVAGAAAATAAALLTPQSAGADPVASNNVLLFDSSLVSPVGNSYNDWEDVVLAIAASGGPHTIQFVQDETIPAGTWNLGSLPTFSGTGVNWFYGGPTVTLEDGCTFTFDGVPGLIIDSALLVVSDSTEPIISTPESYAVLGVERGGAIAANSEVIIEGTSLDPAQMVVLRVADNGWVMVGDSGSVSPPIAAGGHPLIRVTEGLVVTTLGPGPVFVMDDYLEGTGSDLYIVNATTAPPVPIAQAGFAAGMVMTERPMILVNTRAGSLGYTPDGGGGWSPNPTDVQAAIDQLAVRVTALENP